MARVTLLGTKGGPAIYPAASIRMPTSSLLEMGDEKIIIDCGLGVTRGLVGSGFSLKELKTIVITHLHSDHYLELGPLIHTAWTAGLNTPITVYGPHGLTEYWQHFLKSMEFDIDLRIADEGRVAIGPLVSIKPMEEIGQLSEMLTVSALINNHPPIKESYALRFGDGKRAVVFSGDTAPFVGFDAFIAGADLLIHEAMIGEGVERLAARVGNGERLKAHLYAGHTDAADVGALAKKCGIKKLALHHLVPIDDPLITQATWETAVRASGFDGSLQIGHDGLVIDF